MKNIFLTGSTGFLGGELMKRLLTQQPDSHFYLLIRNRSKQRADSRCAELIDGWASELGMDRIGLAARIHLVEGDLKAPSLGLSESGFNELAGKTDVVFHLAASIDLLGEFRKLYGTNVEGTMKLIEFAKLAHRQGGLERFHYVSTAYVSGQQKGVIFEKDLDKGQSFSNDYEKVKLEAEKAVHAVKSQLPVTIYRPSIVVGDSRTGFAPDDCATLDFIKLVVSGKMPFIPGHIKLKLDFVPVDYVADSIAYLSSLNEASLGQTFHLTGGKGHCISSVEIMSIAKEVFEEKQARLGNPGRLRLPMRIHPLLAIGVLGVLSKVKTSLPAKLLKFWITYSRYNWYCKEYDDRCATRLLEEAGIRKPAMHAALKIMMHRNLTVGHLPDWKPAKSAAAPALVPVSQ